MKTKTTLGTILATIILLGLMAPLARADTTPEQPPTGAGGLIIIALIIVAVGIGIAVFIARRKP